MVSTLHPDDITRPEKPKIVAVDFDGVLAKYDGWKGADHHGDPLDKAREALISMLDEGFHVVIFTTRGKADVIHWLFMNDFPIPMQEWHTETWKARARTHLYINEYPHLQGRNPHKPPYHILIDDRAVTFRGSWDDFTPERIRAFKAYWEESGD